MPQILPYLRFNPETLEIGARVVVDRKASVGRCTERVHLCTHRLIDIAEHKRRDGSMGWLLTWQSECSSCGAEFQQVSGAEFKGFMRRCGDCRRDEPRTWHSFPKGPRNRYTLWGLGEIDPQSLF